MNIGDRVQIIDLNFSFRGNIPDRAINTLGEVTAILDSTKDKVIKYHVRHDDKTIGCWYYPASAVYKKYLGWLTSKRCVDPDDVPTRRSW